MLRPLWINFRDRHMPPQDPPLTGSLSASVGRQVQSQGKWFHLFLSPPPALKQPRGAGSRVQQRQRGRQDTGQREAVATLLASRRPAETWWLAASSYAAKDWGWARESLCWHTWQAERREITRGPPPRSGQTSDGQPDSSYIRTWRPLWLVGAAGGNTTETAGCTHPPEHHSSPHPTGRPQETGGAGVQRDWEDWISIRSRHWFSEDSILLKDKPRNTKLSKHNKSKSSPRALLNRVYSTEMGLTGALQGQNYLRSNTESLLSLSCRCTVAGFQRLQNTTVWT